MRSTHKPGRRASLLCRSLMGGALRDFKTGTGFAGAKLSEILPSPRVARVVRMTEHALCHAGSSWRQTTVAMLGSLQ